MTDTKPGAFTEFYPPSPPAGMSKRNVVWVVEAMYWRSRTFHPRNTYVSFHEANRLANELNCNLLGHKFRVTKYESTK